LDFVRRFWRDEKGGVVDTVMTIAAVILVMGPALIILSHRIEALLERIIRYVGNVPGGA
jgi:hypothetical protein